MKKEQIIKACFGKRINHLLPAPVILMTICLLFALCKTKQPEKSAELDGLKVPAGFSIERVASPDLLTYPMFGSFDGQGRLFVFESDGSSPTTEDMLKNPSYHVRLLEDINGDGIFDKSKIFADSLSFPKGGVFYKGSLYVTASPDLLRFTDTDSDGVADKREVILTGWVLNHNGASLGGPFFGPDGWMYLTDARRGFNIATKEGANLKGNSARIWRCRPDGSDLESMCGGGYDNAVEIAFMPSGETVGTMTYFIDPQAGMRDAIMHWVEGGVYPKPYSVIEEDSFKLTGDLMPVMSKMARVAPSGIMRYRGDAFGKEYNGNLFNAEFNTGRIMRRQVIPEGATYRTIDEPFITSTVSDVHLTDVWEDADGSMLILNTGGWFIAGCPLSRVAKLEVHGGIYRITKNGAVKTDDAWGHKLDLTTLSAENITQYTKDPRHAVLDNVIEKLVDLGEAAVIPIRNSLLIAAHENIRAAGVFALYRIHTRNAIRELRSALQDTSVVVRTAAARAVGLAKDEESVNTLMDLAVKDKAPVRRQAATALGQIGDIRAVSALLHAAADSPDRFVEHAIIYSLITLHTPDPLIAAMAHPSWKVRKAAVIALDQMQGSPLRKEMLVPFLASADAQVRNTGIWVASHHADWSDIVLDFLQNQLSAADLPAESASPVRDLMITFSGNKQLQHFMGMQLENTSTPGARKALLIDVISHAPVKEIPGVWIQPLGKLLQGGDPAIRSLVLGLVESRSIRLLNDQLKLIVKNANTPADFRLKALGSIRRSEPTFPDPDFQIALQYLDKKNESPIRQLAARVLASGKLNDTQLLQLAKDQLAQTDLFLLPNLVGAFEGNSNAAVGEALVTALQSSANRLDNLSEQDLQQLFSKYPPSIKTSAEPLLAALREKNAARLSQLEAVSAQLKRGDVGQGRELFYGKAICSSCHAIGNKGGDFAPDLTNIGQIRSKHDILEAILYPSASFAREHETSRIITKTTAYTGIIKEQLPDVVLLATGPGQVVRVERTDIIGIEPHGVSMMPPGLDKQLSSGELSDLMAYLTSLPDGLGGQTFKH